MIHLCDIHEAAESSKMRDFVFVGSCRWGRGTRSAFKRSSGEQAVEGADLPQTHLGVSGRSRSQSGRRGRADGVKYMPAGEPIPCPSDRTPELQGKATWHHPIQLGGRTRCSREVQDPPPALPGRCHHQVSSWLVMPGFGVAKGHLSAMLSRGRLRWSWKQS